MGNGQNLPTVFQCQVAESRVQGRLRTDLVVEALPDDLVILDEHAADPRVGPEAMNWGGIGLQAPISIR